MATLTVQTIDSSDTTTGLSPTYAAADVAGDEFANDGRTFFHVKNGGGGTINITVNSILLCDQGFDHNYVVTLGAGNEAMIGSFGKPRFNNTSTGRTAVTYDVVTSVTVAAIKF